MPDRQKVLRYGGLGLVGVGIFLWLSRGSAGAQPAPKPGPKPGPTSCVRAGQGSLLRGSWFYNWADLQPLPINPNDPHTWSTGGGTTELGWIPGTTVYWSEAKYATSADGITGWYVRVADQPGSGGGAWALPAVDVTTRPVCP
jgi:hypothetical protein